MPRLIRERTSLSRCVSRSLEKRIEPIGVIFARAGTRGSSRSRKRPKNRHAPESVSTFTMNEQRGLCESSLSQFMDSLPGDIRNVCVYLRRLALDAMPQAHELLSHGALGYSVDGSPTRCITHIAPQHNHVNLGFPFGATVSVPSSIPLTNTRAAAN